MYKTHGPRAAMSVGREERRDDHEPKRGSLQGSRKASVMGPVRGGSQDCLVVSVNDTHTHTHPFLDRPNGVVLQRSCVRRVRFASTMKLWYFEILSLSCPTGSYVLLIIGILGGKQTDTYNYYGG